MSAADMLQTYMMFLLQTVKSLHSLPYSNRYSFKEQKVFATYMTSDVSHQPNPTSSLAPPVDSDIIMHALNV